MNPIIAQMIKHSHRSWWQARYSNGRVLSEWDTIFGLKLPLGTTGFQFGNTSRWEEVSKRGMIGLRLLCPNGMCGELEAREGHLFFQIKHGGVDIALGGGAGGRYTDAHIIGVALNDNGNCLCRAWEAYERFTSPEFEKAEALIGHLANEDDIARAKDSLASFHARGYGKWKWRLSEFEDNIYRMKYKNIGGLNLDVQGLKC